MYLILCVIKQFSQITLNIIIIHNTYQVYKTEQYSVYRNCKTKLELLKKHSWSALLTKQASKQANVTLFLKVSVILSESVDLAFVKAFGVEFDTLSQPASFMPKSQQPSSSHPVVCHLISPHAFS